MECYIIIDKVEITTYLSLGYYLRKIKLFINLLKIEQNFYQMKNDVTLAKNPDCFLRILNMYYELMLVKIVVSSIHHKALFWKCYILPA